jgi:hypothetical protein
MRLSATWTPTPINEQQEIVRRRTFEVRSWEDIAQIGNILKAERFFGSVLIHVGPGGTIQHAVAEERGKLGT